MSTLSLRWAAFFFLFVILPGRLSSLPTHCLLIAYLLPTHCLLFANFTAEGCLQCAQVLLAYRPFLRSLDVQSNTPSPRDVFFSRPFHLAHSSMFNCISYFLSFVTVHIVKVVQRTQTACDKDGHLISDLLRPLG